MPFRKHIKAIKKILNFLLFKVRGLNKIIKAKLLASSKQFSKFSALNIYSDKAYRRLLQMKA